jgi:branched-chain amino acid transport system substrate-binding protein
MKPRSSTSFRARARAALASGVLFAAAPASCSLSNVAHDACTGDSDCVSAFGVGSTCAEGYCSEAGSCVTGHDCRKAFGGGACVGGTCQLFVPEDPACTVVDPPDLLDRPLAGDGSTLVVGAIFAKDDKKNEATADSVRLAIQEINDSTGLANGQSIGLVICDNGGKDNGAAGDDRTLLDEHAIDYLAGTLGVPFIVGPRTSGDSLKIIARLVEKKYPTVVISPSATSPELTGVPSRLNAKDPHPLFWRTCPSDALQGKVLASLVSASPMTTTAAVVYANDAYGKGLSKVFLSAFGSDNTHLVEFDASKLDDMLVTDGIAMNVSKSGSDAIVIVAVSAGDTIKLLGGMAKAGLTSKSFFLTDGSKDAATLLDPALPADVMGIIAQAKGTAPASARDEATFKLFAASLGLAFPGVDPAQYSFLAHAYDAAYLGAFGVVYAAGKDKKYDGRGVAEGIAHLEAGMSIEVGAVPWPGGKQELATSDQINLVGISGNLDLDPMSGEGPAPIEVWAIQGGSFITVDTVMP